MLVFYHSIRLHSNVYETAVLFSIISSNFSITSKIFGIFQIITIILIMLANIEVNVKTASSYSWIESAVVNRNVTVDTRNKIGGSKRNVRLGFGCDGKKPIASQNFWTHWKNFNFSFSFIDVATSVTIISVNFKQNRFDSTNSLKDFPPLYSKKRKSCQEKIITQIIGCLRI